MLKNLMSTSTPFRTVLPLILASASPRRQEFLQDMGLDFTCVRPTGIEPDPAAGETPVDYAQRAADAKALAVAQNIAQSHPHAAVLAADTIVSLGPEIFGKPSNAEQALNMLKKLSGKTHLVTTALSLILPHGSTQAATMTHRTQRLHRSTTVSFYPWPEALLQAYVATGEPMDKAGAYAIQGQGAFLVEHIEGSWSTVVGLPLTELMALLLKEKIITVRG